MLLDDGLTCFMLRLQWTCPRKRSALSRAWSTGVFLSEINNAGKKAGKQTNATDNVTRRASLASLDDCRRGVREQLSDRWGQSRPLYRRSARSGGADLYITRESLFRRGRATAPEGSRESGARRPGVTPARNLRDTRSSAALAFSICLRRSLAPATRVAFVLHARHRTFPPSSLTRRQCRPYGLQFSRLRNETI